MKLPFEAELQRREAVKQLKIYEGTVEEVRERCKSLVQFAREAWHVLEAQRVYVHGWHIDLICKHLEAITYDKFKAKGFDNRLLINEPPGTMKSLLVNVFWTAWEWGPAGMPHIQNIATSYKGDNCTRDCGKVRDLVLSDWYQKHWPQVKLVKTGEWEITTEQRGSYKGIPFGSLTQWRADRVKIDDPHSVDTAESEVERQRATMRFRESVTSRLNDPKKSAIVVIMQRLHEDDVSGIIIRFRLGYVFLRLPMEYEADNPCETPFGKDPRTVEGELLFPERFSKHVVERDKHTFGPYAVAGQFQQRPAPRQGGLFERSWFQLIDNPFPNMRWVRGWDFAATKSLLTTGKQPYTVGVKMGIDPKRRIVISNVKRIRGSPQQVEELVLKTAMEDGFDVEISIPQDPGQAGKAQVQYYTTQLQGYKVHHSPETGSKEDRARPMASQAEVGNAYLVRAPWNEAYLSEAEMFPAGSTRDQIDASSRAHARLVRGRVRRIPYGAEIVGDISDIPEHLQEQDLMEYG